MSENVKVVIRIRPFLPNELAWQQQEQQQQQQQQQEPLESSYNEGAYLNVVENQVVVDNNRTFAFDAVLDAQSTHKDVFSVVGKDVVEAFLDGRNAATIAYGQTGAGKTYTMQSLTMNVIDAIFAQLENRLALVSPVPSRRPSSLSNTLTTDVTKPNETTESKTNNKINCADNSNNEKNACATHSTFLSSTTSYSATTAGQTNTTSTITVRSSLASSSNEELEEEEAEEEKEEEVLPSPHNKPQSSQKSREEEKQSHVEQEENNNNNNSERNEELTSSPSFTMLVSVLEVYNDTLKDLISLDMIPTEDGNDHYMYPLESCKTNHNYPHHNSKHRRHSFSLLHHSINSSNHNKHNSSSPSLGVNGNHNNNNYNKHTAPYMTSPCKALSPTSRSCTPPNPHCFPSSCCTALSPSLLSSPSSLSPINYNGNNNKHEQEYLPLLQPSSHISPQSTRSRREERLNSFSSCNSIPSPTSCGAIHTGNTTNNNYYYFNNNYNNSNKGKVVLQLREDAKNGVYVHNLTEVIVRDANQLKQIISRATATRHTATTLLNANSSRSHCIVTLTLHYRGTTSKMCFVDLAGSERLKKSLGLNKSAAESLQALLQFQSHSNTMTSLSTSPSSSGSASCGINYSNATNALNSNNFLSNAEADALVMARMREGISVNTGLLALGNVIVALCEHKPHIPYRASKLTRLLQPMLNGLSRTCMVACISPFYGALEETLNTLKYAYRAKSIKIHPQVMLSHFDSREDAEKTIIALRLEIKELQNKLKAWMQEKNASEGANTGEDNDSEKQHADKESKQKQEEQEELTKVESKSLESSVNVPSTTPIVNDKLNKQTTELCKEHVQSALNPQSTLNELPSSMLINMEAKIMYLEKELAAERTLTHKLEEDVFRAEYTAMVEIEKRKVLEQRLEEVETTLYTLQHDEELECSTHEHKSKAITGLLNNSSNFAEHPLSTPLSHSSLNNDNNDKKVHVWNNKNTTKNTAKPERNHTYQDNKCEGNSPIVNLLSITSSSIVDSGNHMFSKSSSGSIMFRSETNSFARNESKIRDESEIPSAKVTMCFIEEDYDDEANITTNNVNIANNNNTNGVYSSNNNNNNNNIDVEEKKKGEGVTSTQTKELVEDIHGISKSIERDRSNSLNKLTVVKFNTLVSSNGMEKNLEEKQRRGSKLNGNNVNNDNKRRKPSLMKMKRSVSHYAPITTHSIFDEDHISVTEKCGADKSNGVTNGTDEKEEQWKPKETNEISKKRKKYEELLHQHRRLVRTASAQPFLSLRNKTSNTATSSENERRKNSSFASDDNNNNHNNNKFKRVQSTTGTLFTPINEASKQTKESSDSNANKNERLEKLKEQWQTQQKTRQRGQRREIYIESNTKKECTSQHTELINKKNKTQSYSSIAAERNSSSITTSIRTKKKKNCINESVNDADLQASEKKNTVKMIDKNAEDKNVKLEPFQRTSHVAKMFLQNAEQDDDNNNKRTQSIKEEQELGHEEKNKKKQDERLHSPVMLEQHVTKEMENAIAKFKAMNTEATHVGNQSKTGLFQSSLSSVSVNSNSQQDHIQHAIDSELHSLEEIEREVEELENYRLVLKQLQKTKASDWAEQIAQLARERVEIHALLQNSSANDKEPLISVLPHSASSSTSLLPSETSTTPPNGSIKEEFLGLEKSSSLSMASLTTNVSHLESSGESAPLLSSTAPPLGKWSVASSELPLLHHVRDKRKLKSELHKLKVEIDQVQILAEMSARSNEQMQEVELRLESLHEVRRIRSQRVRRLQHMERENTNNAQELSVSSFSSSLHTNNNNNINKTNKTGDTRVHSDMVEENDGPYSPLTNVFQHNLPLSSLPQPTNNKNIVSQPPPLPSVREITSSRLLHRSKTNTVNNNNSDNNKSNNTVNTLLMMKNKTNKRDNSNTQADKIDEEHNNNKVDESNDREKIPEIDELKAAVDELAKEFRLNEPLASAKRRARSRKPRNKLQQVNDVHTTKEKSPTKSIDPLADTTAATKTAVNKTSATASKKITVTKKPKTEEYPLFKKRK